MACLKIITPGFMTTVQDKGRHGFQKQGIPVSGAMDTYALELANLLVGNERSTAGLEVTFSGPMIEFDANRAIAITGANLSPAINGRAVELNQTIQVSAGDVLGFGALRNGARAYIAVEGGIDVPLVMGSRSTYLKAGIGGFNGRRLQVGDCLDLSIPDDRLPLGKRKLPANMILQYKREIHVRVILGPEDARFTDESINTFLNNAYEFTNQSDRMGLRLTGPVLHHITGPDILSAGINFGAIQVAGDGQPIVLMADRQTTGGYTRIASVISVDLPLMAQAKPGDTVRFHSIDISDAQRLLLERERQIKALKNSYEQASAVLAEKVQNYRVTVNGREYEVSVMEIK